MLDGSAAIDAVFNNGGFTVPSSGGLAPTTGYVVAVGRSTLVLDVSDREHAMDYYYSAISAFGRVIPERYVGGWLDAETSLMHLDGVEVVDTLDEARALGAQRNQIAVFDLDTNSEVRL